ncbi:hypothetical protein TWF281_010315 [Arthrobotrys megalospora]
MRLETLYLATLSTLTQAQWSYRLAYTPLPRERASWATVPANDVPKPCTALSRRFTKHNRKTGPGPDSQSRYLNGIAIQQPAETDNNGDPKMVTYLGFWTSTSCKGVPKYVVHFKAEPRTIQTALFQKFDTFIPGFNASDYHIWGWGEIPQGDLVFGNTPAGAVGFRESGTNSWVGNYMIVENILGEGPQSLRNIEEADGNPGTRATHWHVNIGNSNPAIARPKNEVYRPITTEIVSYRYFGPLPPEDRRMGGDDGNRRAQEVNQNAEGMIRMEEEPGLPPPYNIDENKRAILKAYVEIHGVESALYELQKMVDEHRFQYYMNRLTPELQEVARREGIFQLPLDQRADRLAEQVILRETLRRRVSEREAFLAGKMADLQRERDARRNMVLFLMNEMRGLEGLENGNANANANANEEARGGDEGGDEEGEFTIQYSKEQEERRPLNPNANNGNNGDRRQGTIEIESQPPVQISQESRPLGLNFQAVSNSEMAGVSDLSASQNSNFETGVEINLGASGQNLVEWDQRSNYEDLVKAEEENRQENEFIDPELASVIDEEFEQLVKSEYDELLRSEGLDNNSGSLQDFDEFSPDTIPEESLDQIPERSLNRISEESIGQIPVEPRAQRQISEEFLVKEEAPVKEEALAKEEPEAENTIVPEPNDIIIPPQQNPEISLNSEIEIESNDVPTRFATSFGRTGYQQEASLDGSPELIRQTTSHGRMSYSDWLASQADRGIPVVVDEGVVSSAAQEGGEQEQEADVKKEEMIEETQ